MQEEKVHIFIDEFGNTELSLKKEGTPSHFVYAAVIIPDKEIADYRNLRDAISILAQVYPNHWFTILVQVYPNHWFKYFSILGPTNLVSIVLTSRMRTGALQRWVTCSVLVALF